MERTMNRGMGRKMKRDNEHIMERKMERDIERGIERDIECACSLPVSVVLLLLHTSALYGVESHFLMCSPEISLK